MKEESRGRYLFKNTAIFAIGNMGTKLINFFMVPLYTYALTTSEYGTINSLLSICYILVPLVMCNISEAVRRYLLDKNADIYGIQTVEFIWCCFGLVVSVIMFVILRLIPGTADYAGLMSLYVFFNALVITCLDYLRGKELLHLYTFCSLLQTFVVAALNIYFLVYLHKGVEGYLFSYVLAYAICAFLAFVLGGQFQDLKHVHFEKEIFIEMSKFSLTLVPNSLLWWITNASDKLMVTYFISAAANGIYSISTKLPTMLSTMNTVLMQAWQYSAIKECDASDKVEYNNRMYQLYVATVSVVGAGLLLINRPFMQLYVSPEFREAWLYSPFLILGSVFSTLGTFVGTSYYVEKDMKGNLKSAFVGALVNIILNFLLIPTMGITGAAIATCTSYLAVLIFRIIDTRKYLPIDAMTPYSMRLLAVMLYMLACSYVNGILSYLLLSIGMCAVLFLTRQYYIDFMKKIIGKMKR